MSDRYYEFRFIGLIHRKFVYEADRYSLGVVISGIEQFLGSVGEVVATPYKAGEEMQIALVHRVILNAAQVT